MKKLLFLFLCVFCLIHQAEAKVIDGYAMMEQDMEQNLCVLTFDDGPSTFTEQLLDMLKVYDIKVTFFMLGRMVNLYPEIVKRAAAEGHDIATHTYSHKNLKRLSFDRQLEEIRLGYESLARLGLAPTYMRPPYGNFDERTRSIAQAYGLHIVLWSMDSKDWKRLPDDYSQILSVHGTPMEEGQMHGVFLFHDIHKTTVDDLPRIVEQLTKAGCEKFVPLSQYLEGILDPEPPLMLTRRKIPHPATSEEQDPNTVTSTNPATTDGF